MHRGSVASELLEPGLLTRASPAPTAAPVGEPELQKQHGVRSGRLKVSMVIYRVPGRDAQSTATRQPALPCAPGDSECGPAGQTLGLTRGVG